MENMNVVENASPLALFHKKRLAEYGVDSFLVITMEDGLYNFYMALNGNIVNDMPPYYSTYKAARKHFKEKLNYDLPRRADIKFSRFGNSYQKTFIIE